MIFESVNMPATTAYVELLPTFRCRIEGEVVSLPEALRSLLVTVILEKGVGRRTVQRRLWPDEPQVAAAKRMRQLLWRLNRATSGKLLKIDTEFIRLGDSVGVDLFEADLKVRALLDFTGAQTGRREHWRFLDLPLLCGWPAEAICAEQERWDCLRMLGLEKLATRSLEADDCVGAIEYATSALKIDPLQETPYRQLAEAHLLRGDHATAHRLYQRYAGLLRTELGIKPSSAFDELVKSPGTGGEVHEGRPLYSRSSFVRTHSRGNGAGLIRSG